MTMTPAERRLHEEMQRNYGINVYRYVVDGKVLETVHVDRGSYDDTRMGTAALDNEAEGRDGWQLVHHLSVDGRRDAEPVDEDAQGELVDDLGAGESEQDPGESTVDSPGVADPTPDQGGLGDPDDDAVEAADDHDTREGDA